MITPDSSEYANSQYIEIGLKEPGFSAPFYVMEEKESSVGFFHILLFGKPETQNKFPIISYNLDEDELKLLPYDQFRSLDGDTLIIKIGEELLKEGKEEWIHRHIQTKTFWLGTDRFGRDLLSRIIIGLRISLAVGFAAVLISLLIGVSLGAMAGYFGGKTDKLIMWLINVIWSLPSLLLIIAITFALGKGFWQMFLAIGLSMWVEVARVVRGQMMSIKQNEYIEAARALAFSHYRIITKHILPNIWGPVIVISAANFSTAILVEAGLSFLGLGVAPPIPSLGGMIRENYAGIFFGYSWLSIFPGLMIIAIVLSLMILGRSLKVYLNKN